MKRISGIVALIALASLAFTPVQGQEDVQVASHTLYDIPPRQLVNMPTAGTLPRGYFNIGLRLYAGGGAMANTDIGLSSRLQLGLSYGGEKIVSATNPDWNPRMGFSIKFRVVDELEFFPAITIGFCDQGYGYHSAEYDRYQFKSRGFYAVASRSFYFYKWTSGWHAGVNYSREYDGDDDDDVSFFAGIDATFNYNLALALEYDAALNDNKTEPSEITGRGRGYMNMSIKWLFAENLELEIYLTDLLQNRRETDTFGRGVRMVYIDHF